MNVVPGRAPVDLLAELADEDVHRAVAVALAAAPDALHQLLARDHAALLRARARAAAGTRSASARRSRRRRTPARSRGSIDELLDLDPLAALGRLRADAAADGGAHAGDELAHRERLDEVVVGADLERADPVALGAARADDDDRRADPLAADGLDQLPAVEARAASGRARRRRAARSGAARARSRPARRAAGRSRRAPRWRAIPSAMTSSSSTISTLAIAPTGIDRPDAIRPGCQCR